ncbi:MAG: hypothetical protein ACTSRC_05055 [Candidatus Helarchaeota archaeon]
MTIWTVKLEGVYPGTEDDIVLKFTDIRESSNPMVLERYIIQNISDMCNVQPNYHALPNVKEVVSESNEKLIRERAAIILATFKDKKKIGILLYLHDEMTYEVLGIRNEEFVKEVLQNDKKVMEILIKLTREQDQFEDVNLIIPESRF